MLRFDEVAFDTPSRESLAARYAAVGAMLDRGGRTEALAAWDAARREHASWTTMALIRFFQDTQSAEAKAGRELADALKPVAQGHDVAVKRRLLADPDRAGLEQEAGLVSPFKPGVLAKAMREVEAYISSIIPDACIVNSRR